MKNKLIFIGILGRGRWRARFVPSTTKGLLANVWINAQVSREPALI